jgi:Cof subfamily protein (haloacid dehalogenase superfamily)
MEYRRLIACDLDGTLLDRESHVSNDIVVRLKEILPSDVAFTLATGRELRELRSLVAQLGCIHVPIIAETGAVLLNPDTGVEIASQPMPPLVINQVLATLESGPWEYNVYLSGGGRCMPFCSHPGIWFEDIPETQELRPLLRDINEWHKTDLTGIHRICLRCEPLRTHKVRDAISRAVRDLADVNQSDTNCIDILAAGVNKGVALRRLMQLLEISAADVMAIGDAETDVSMFAVAGVSVAMENANDIAKEAARFVVPSNNNEGVLVAVEHFVSGGYDA